MHQTDGSNHAAGLFVDRNLMTPTPGTQIEKDWLNAIQAEIITPITEAAITLVKGTNTQLRDALRVLFVRAAGNATQTITGSKNFTGLVSMIRAAGVGLANLTIENVDPGVDSFAVNITSNSIGTTAKFRNTSTARAAQFQSEDGISTIRLVPLTVLPASAADGDMVYVAGALNMMYARINGIWTALA